MRRTIVLIAMVATTAGLLAACSGDEEFPAGAYVSTADVNGLGPVTVTYGDDGAMGISQGDETSFEGTYLVDGDQITMSDKYCKRLEGQETATYTWEWDGSVLTMTTSEDSCTSRNTTVTEMTPAE